MFCLNIFFHLDRALFECLFEVEAAAAAAERNGGGGGGGIVLLNIGFVFVLLPQYDGGGGSNDGGGGNCGGNGIFIEFIIGLAPQTISFPVFFCSPIVSTVVAVVVVAVVLFMLFIFTFNLDLNARFFNCNPIEDVSSKLKKKSRKRSSDRRSSYM